MKTVALASIVSFVLICEVGAQSRPDLSGTWRFDPNRSDSATYPELSRPVTLVIVQTAADVRIDTATARGKTTDVFQFRSTDGVPAPGAAIARWSGDRLIVDAVRDIRGQSVTVQQMIMLSADGKELTIESTVNVQHGYTLGGAKVYGTGKDMFVRVP